MPVAQAAPPPGQAGGMGRREGLWLQWRQRDRKERNTFLHQQCTKHRGATCIDYPSLTRKKLEPREVNGFPSHTAKEESEPQKQDLNPGLSDARAMASGSRCVVHRLPPEWETHTSVPEPQPSRWALLVQDGVRSTDPCPGAQCGS